MGASQGKVSDLNHRKTGGRCGQVSRACGRGVGYVENKRKTRKTREFGVAVHVDRMAGKVAWRRRGFFERLRRCFVADPRICVVAQSLDSRKDVKFVDRIKAWFHSLKPLKNA